MFLLESGDKQVDKGRFTFLGYEPYGEIIGYEHKTIVKIGKEVKEYTAPFLEVIKEYIPIMEDEDEVPFVGGAVGFIGYDIIRQHEQIGTSLPKIVATPDAHLFLYDDIYVYDNVKEVGYRYKGYKRCEQISKEIFSLHIKKQAFQMTNKQANMTEEVFIKKVEKAKEHILRGDIFQLVLSQRFQFDFQGNTVALYDALRHHNPSPYMYYLDFEAYQLIGTSPESLVSVQKDIVKTNPIAGTAPRKITELEDKEQENVLRKDEKELAEHYMLLDLGRNDIGKVCEIGSVTVNRFLDVERYRSVMHLVSEVTGQLKKECTMLDVLKACLPAGTVSGAPKIRAMQLINELEEERRGIYSGAVGYLSATGNMDMALTIRTIVVKDKKAYVQAGAGIVLDSIGKKEYEETIHKAKALVEVGQNDFVNR
ncbi:MAG: anthranilate synthase component I family protein [Bacillaceae bacterium]